MKKIALILANVLLLSGFVKNPDRQKLVQSPVVVSNDSEKMPEIKKKGDILYEYKSDTLIQKLSVGYLSNKEIRFQLTSVNIIRHSTSTLAGTALAKLNQDPELDEDDAGNSYPSTEYHYSNGNCLMGIRIAMNTKDKAKIFEYNCESLHKKDCPFASFGVLKKVSD
jgi:hypothetical protein